MNAGAKVPHLIKAKKALKLITELNVYDVLQQHRSYQSLGESNVD